MMMEALQTDLGNLVAAPGACRMLAGGAHFALRLPREERHELHQFVVNRIQEVLASISAQLSEAVEEAKKKCNALAVTYQQLHDDLEATSKVFDSAKHEAEEQQEKVDAAELEARAARKDYKVAAERVSGVQKRRAQWEKELARHQDNDAFNALLEGTCESDRDVRRLLDKLDKFFASIGAEQALLTSARTALAAKQDARRDFDVFTIEYLKTFQAASAARIEEKIRGGEAEEAGLATVSEDAIAVVEAKRALVAEQEERLAPLKEAESDKFKQMKAAQEALESHRTAYRQCNEVVESAETDVRRFSVLDEAFKFLSNRSNEEEKHPTEEQSEKKQTENINEEIEEFPATPEQRTSCPEAM